jgi:hypothetical protein
MTQKKLFLMLAMISSFQTIFAQNTMYGLIRKVYDHTYYDPITMTMQTQFDSATIKLGNLDLTSNTINPISTNEILQNQINITSSALNPYSNKYMFSNATSFVSFDLTSGIIASSPTISNPINNSYFDNYIFNNSDSSIYGLARRSFYDSVTQTNTGEMFLSKINPNSGVITQISNTSVGEGYSLSGRAIDPYQMVYYFSGGNNLRGLDLYNGSIYNTVPLIINDSSILRSFAYSCADSTMYGLFNKNYFSEDTSMGFPTYTLDSTDLRLAKINLTTGQINNVSNTRLKNLGVAINAGCAINPNTMSYYISNGGYILAISLVTGNIIDSIPVSSSGANYFDLMVNTQNCYNATKVRTSSTPLTSSNNLFPENINVFPNPTTGKIKINIDDNSDVQNVQITTLTGSIVYKNRLVTNDDIDISRLTPGIYFISVQTKNKIYKTKLSKL